MRLRISRILLVAAAAAPVFGSTAYAQEINVRARVPFDFVLGDSVYPAGEYALQTAMRNTGFLSISNDDKTTRGLTSSHPCISSKPAGPANQAKLVFRRMGGTYFLFRVWVGASTVCREFPKSTRETEMATNGPKTETIIVAANTLHCTVSSAARAVLHARDNEVLTQGGVQILRAGQIYTPLRRALWHE